MSLSHCISVVFFPLRRSEKACVPYHFRSETNKQVRCEYLILFDSTFEMYCPFRFLYYSHWISTPLRISLLKHHLLFSPYVFLLDLLFSQRVWVAHLNYSGLVNLSCRIKAPKLNFWTTWCYAVMANHIILWSQRLVNSTVLLFTI